MASENRPVVIVPNKRALYFGGHYLHDASGSKIYEPHPQGLPWRDGELDGGLLTNGNVRDRYDGRVLWMAGGTPLWLAFCWWDNSLDGRSGSNSGFYVTGFHWNDRAAAFAFARNTFPGVVKRQRFPQRLCERGENTGKGLDR